MMLGGSPATGVQAVSPNILGNDMMDLFGGSSNTGGSSNIFGGGDQQPNLMGNSQPLGGPGLNEIFGVSAQSQSPITDIFGGGASNGASSDLFGGDVFGSMQSA